MTPEERELIKWARREYRRRARLIREDQGQIDWLDPGTRVSWTEIWMKAEELGLEPRKDVVAFRLWWDDARNWKEERATK